MLQPYRNENNLIQKESNMMVNPNDFNCVKSIQKGENKNKYDFDANGNIILYGGTSTFTCSFMIRLS